MKGPEVRWRSPWRETHGTTILHVDLAPNDERENHAYELLDDEEKLRWRKFLSERSRRQFVLCRAALPLSLSECLECSNSQLSFGYREFGKPFAAVDGTPVSIGFNVSHSGQHGLIALADRICVGVDVEERVARHDLDGISELVYGPAERQSLSAVDGEQKVYRFFRLWSLKEALIKALGSGFSVAPCGLEVPGAMLLGVESGEFRFPHAPSATWGLVDLGEARFAAAMAYKVSHSTSRLYEARTRST